MAPHSSTLAWRIPRTEEPGRLQSMESRRVGHDWVTSLSRIGEGNGNPLQCSCPENPRDGGAWWAAVYGVAQDQTQLKWLTSSSSSSLQNHDRIHFCYFKQPSLWHFDIAALGTEHNSSVNFVFQVNSNAYHQPPALPWAQAHPSGCLNNFFTGCPPGNSRG